MEDGGFGNQVMHDNMLDRNGLFVNERATLTKWKEVVTKRNVKQG